MKLRKGLQLSAIYAALSGGRQGTPPLSVKATKSWGVADTYVSSFFADLDTKLGDIVSVLDSNGSVNLGWPLGMAKSLAASYPQFAGQLSGYCGNASRGSNTYGSQHPGGSDISADPNWTVGVHNNLSNYAFSSWGIHQAVLMHQGTNSTAGALMGSLNDLTTANFLRPQQAVYADLFYGVGPSGGDDHHKHHTRKDVNTSVGGASATINNYAASYDIVRSRRPIDASAANTTLETDAFWSSWSTNADSETMLVGTRWSSQTRNAGWADHIAYQGGGQAMDDAAVALTGATKRASAAWYLGQLRNEQLARQPTAVPRLLFIIWMGVNDAGDENASLVDGVTVNNTQEGFYLNTTTYIDWIIDVYTKDVGGSRNELHFAIIPGFAMEESGVGKDVAHEAAIIPAAIQIANEYARTACYNFRAVFPETVMTASSYYNAVDDRNHLSALGYADMSAQMISDIVTDGVSSEGM